ncbi:MAG TPA: sialidase family protein, partial [Planctomycetota bacterium]|nr:sialidase family protein [Planctomycetota bacterium]
MTASGERPAIALLVGTRKGCFVLEGDGERRRWKIRGPFCEGWPVYHAVYDPASATIFAAAASEWHGAGVWRSSDFGETWELSSAGLAYGEDSGLRLSKVSGLAPAHGRLLAGAEAAGVFESRDGGETWSLLSTLDGQPGRDV